ncbi:c-type cytochrome [Stagnihabitans tardus]|uniref:Cytochrome C n=1 Tax=Stagnihabitans tardus TaxID=2699202 RepID=A0AAE4Y5Y7_9RHOB|nr:c-type cytochrome [Stagnihabitans tardus]NBZ86386.1 cytochrome C [Stagnihabitans tardus]
MKTLIGALALSLMTLPAFAEGDAAAGAKVFQKCQTCHAMVNEAGEVVAGKGAKTGPNLYGLPGRVAGSVEGFKYGDDMLALGATGFQWGEADFVAYVADPSKFLQEKLSDSKARGKMMFKLPKADDAANVWAYIASLSPAPAAP